MEKIMKALIASVIAVAAVSAAMPAAAQSFGRYDDFDRGRGRSEASRIEQRIDVGLRNGSLTTREASLLRRDLRVVQDLEWRFARDGRISEREVRELDARYAQVSARVRVERRDPDRRYGSNDRFGDRGYNDRGYSDRRW